MILLRQWDRLSKYLLIMTFGVYSTVYPLISLRASAPYWISILLGSEFFCAGVLLTVGMFQRSGYRIAGLLVIGVGLATISLVIATYGGTRVLAYAFLFGAFAMQSVYEIRDERRARKVRRENELRLVEELTQLVRENGQGDKV